MTTAPDSNSPDNQQPNRNTGIGDNHGNIYGKARVAGRYDDNSRSEQTEIHQANVARIEANNVYIGDHKAEPLLDRLENAGQHEGIGVFRTGDLVKATANWQGREAELKKLMGWLQDPNVRLMGIQAIGGMGKSTLAAKLYESDKLPLRKAYWVNATNGASFVEVAKNILTEFGGRIPEQEQQLCEGLVQCLCQESCLLIIDNLESLLTEAQEWTGPLWREFFVKWQEYGRSSKVLVTSREQPIEPVFPRYWLALGGLKEDAGVALLQAQGIQGNLATFVELVNGHPLLLTIVANVLNTEFPNPDRPPSLDNLPSLGLGNLQELLTHEKAKGQHREETVGLAVVLEATFQRLSEVQQQLFLAASVFRQPFNEEMARAASGVELDADIVDKELQQIANKSLLESRWEQGRKYNFQPVVQEYARYEAGTNEKAHKNAIDFYGLRANKDQKLWQTLEDIQEYLEITYHWLELEEINQAFLIIRQFDNFLALRSCSSTRIDIYQLLIETYKRLDQSLVSWQYGLALTGMGSAYQSLGEYGRAITFYQKHLDIARKIGDQQTEAGSLCNIGHAYKDLEKYQEAVSCYKQSLAISTQINYQPWIANALGGLGNVYSCLGEYERAIIFHQQHFEIAKKIGDQQGISNAYGGLGFAYQSLGEYEHAIIFHKESLSIAKAISDRREEIAALGGLGLAYQSLGEHENAIVFHQQSLDVAREISDRRGEAASLDCLGLAYQGLGEYENAIASHQKSLEIGRGIGDQKGEVNSLYNLASTYQILREYKRAIGFYKQSLNIVREIGDRQKEANYLCDLGKVYQILGEYEQAITFYRQSLEIQREIGDQYGEGYSLIGLGFAYLRLGKIRNGIIATQQVRQIIMHMDVPLDAYPIPTWMKSIARFAQQGKFQLALLFIGGIFAFPFFLIWIILLITYRLLRRPFLRR